MEGADWSGLGRARVVSALGPPSHASPAVAACDATPSTTELAALPGRCLDEIESVEISPGRQFPLPPEGTSITYSALTVEKAAPEPDVTVYTSESLEPVVLLTSHDGSVRSYGSMRAISSYRSLSRSEFSVIGGSPVTTTSTKCSR